MRSDERRETFVDIWTCFFWNGAERSGGGLQIVWWKEREGSIFDLLARARIALDKDETGLVDLSLAYCFGRGK